MLSTVGMLVMISANDLIALYLGLELQSLSAYVIASFHRDNLRSTEAGLKYFVLGALLLRDAALRRLARLRLHRHGLLRGHRDGAPRRAPGLGIILGIVFVAAGIAFKISAAPFHMWTPDVYEGAPTPVTAFFASAPKMAAMALMVRVFVGAFPGILAQWQQIVIFIAIISMTLGCLRGDRAAQLQAADGLFLDRQCRLRADRACGRDAGRRPGRRRLHGDLSCDDARRLRLHPRDAPRRGR